MNDWKELIENLNKEGTISDGDYKIFYKSDVDSGDEKIIDEKADLPYNEENFKEDYYRSVQSELFKTLDDNNSSLSDIQNNLSKIWPAIIWNESMAKLIADFWYYYKKSENDFIVEKKDGTIDSYFTNVIAAAGANASLRKTDIRDADAGYFFGREEATYEECYYIGNRDGSSCTLVLTSSYIDSSGNTVDGTRTYTISDIIFKSSQTNKIEALLNKNFNIITVQWLSTLFDSSNKWYGTYSTIDTGDFREDHVTSATFSTKPEMVKIITNPWVVPWYNFDADTYSTVRGNDKHYSVLANEDYLQKTREQGHKKNKSDSSYEWLRLLMPEYKRHVEVEDINRNFWVIGQVVGAISAYLFDDESPISKLIQGILNEILQLWENVLLLWAMIGTQKVRNYDKTHCEVIYLTNNDFQPYLKYDGFDNIDISNYENLIEEIKERLKYLIYQYSDYNLVILPEIRLQNYENNFYSEAYYPCILRLNRNNSEEWEVIKIKKGNQIGIDIKLSTYNKCLYGFTETEEEYYYFCPLSQSENIDVNEDKNFYGAARGAVSLEGLDVINLRIEYVDAVATILNKTNNIFSLKYTYNGKVIEEGNDKIINIDYSECDDQELSFETLSILSITKGIYLGELLSDRLFIIQQPWKIQERSIELQPYFSIETLNTNETEGLVNENNQSMIPKSKNYVINGKSYQAPNGDNWNNWFESHQTDFAENNISIYEAYLKEKIETTPRTIYLLYGSHMYGTNYSKGADNKVMIATKPYYYGIQNGELKDESAFTPDREYHTYITTQGRNDGMLIYLPIENGIITKVLNYRYQTDYWNTKLETGGYALSNSLIEIYYSGKVLTKDNWIVKYTNLSAVEINNHLNPFTNEVSESDNTQKEKWEKYQLNQTDKALQEYINYYKGSYIYVPSIPPATHSSGQNYLMAVVSIGITYIHPNGSINEIWVQRDHNNQGQNPRRINFSSDKIYEKNWASRPNLSNYVLYQQTKSGNFNSYNAYQQLEKYKNTFPNFELYPENGFEN